jgi:hypothetical protein
MSNPLETPEHRRAIAELRSLLQQPQRGYRSWLRQALGQRTYEKLVELQDDKAHRLVPDRIWHLNIADPAHDDQ